MNHRKINICSTDCACCGHVLETTKARKIHNFFKHYDQGKGLLFEKRLISIERFGGLISYKINFSDHDFYNFTDSEDIAENILNVVKHKYVPPGHKV